MQRKSLIALLIFVTLLSVATTAFSGPLKIAPDSMSFETEVIADDNGYSFSQYGFLFWNNWNALLRGFTVEPVRIRHGEFEFGPTFRFSLARTSVEVINSFGFTIDGSFTTGHTIITEVLGKKIIFLADPKWYFWNKNRADELLHRFVINDIYTIGGIPISLRSEHLTDYRDTIYWRIGPQLSLFTSLLPKFLRDGDTFTLMPHYEARNNTFGCILTFTLNR